MGLAELVRKKEVTPKELKDTALKGIEMLNPKLNAIVSVLSEQSEEEINKGLCAGPFMGFRFL
ncbi:hypothetical protein [Aneurinibacillus migulanus]|uniref:Amidase n=1 Tax=Aneurinibacillus migulanus TaxID=47500 RepID=A0A0D1WFE4_ANEMI|nr:hypothetical protein [Aneurinibacillus migulanus]KIV57245.1 hypothetical protein TS65_10780 [Aneurinibacillus migulanus]KON96860.1 hypothetical protein AF333_16605 [Aneurinibacillus migulanus]MED1619454.1 hypothetical protein [Aneurinibacillus migulanus]GED14148.1 hypothetical protein AMI01nite_21390 [Aneurinibacillus migulanus]